MAKKSKAPARASGRSARPHAAKPDRKKKGCVVCGSEVAPFSDENLCWVCRRLKISAWREADSQAMMQE
jgi:ribosomal protein S14